MSACTSTILFVSPFAARTRLSPADFLCSLPGAETQGGQRLLPRVEFHAGSEATWSVPFARATTDDPKQSGILYCESEVNRNGEGSELN